MSPNTTGALLMMASMACFTFNDALLKLTDGAVPLAQLLFLRGVLASVLIFTLAKWLNALSFNITRGDWAMIATRSGAGWGGLFLCVGIAQLTFGQCNGHTTGAAAHRGGWGGTGVSRTFGMATYVCDWTWICRHAVDRAPRAGRV